jgi:hypothetical protein
VDGLMNLKDRRHRTEGLRVAERYRAAEIPAASLLVGLHSSDALSNAISLGLSEGCGDRQEQLADPIARDVAAQVEQVELDAPTFLLASEAAEWGRMIGLRRELVHPPRRITARLARPYLVRVMIMSRGDRPTSAVS